jgi:hypothetical protein
MVPATKSIEELRTIQKNGRTTSFYELLSAINEEGYIFHERFAGCNPCLAARDEPADR